ncbi:MAG: fimbrial protein [Stenotrophomonas sp.]|uniref:fimbrial protein n=1 Tax=Stenotrophomonas sp. TaxID=69392 RepID=UPI003D6DA65B
MSECTPGYGPASTSASAQNRWLAGTAQDGQFVIPLTARYVQDGPTVEPGSANANATITFSYQ